MRWFISFPLKPNGDSQAGRVCFYELYDGKNGHKFIMKNDILGRWRISSSLNI
jgi:hypothetical protein